ncbi:hypothetical protein BKA67DRAFT_664094 [Truncatella angustata]|uniref:DUF1593-domain-containing protein n=1 Tax=Truncatella angustata TaxID=152316 RepID=A0A9P8RLG3_9PEZI|nr:uncharacterized protein BKA67DRAFT_664094 [Truncatella angustata]KAH6646246.1 hypothetical protein BKA67DRAFT_664094 [Truncatella angustata]
MARYGFITRLITLCFSVQTIFAVSVNSGYNATDIQDTLQSFRYKPRIFILSDILNEPDDSMSLVRYLLYSNEFDTRGICATTSWWLQNATHPEQMRTIIKAYGEVVDNLNNHVHPSASYQNPDELLELVTSGPATYGRAALNEMISEGAQHLIAALQESEEPLYIGAWGGTNTLAQALLYMDQTLSASEAKDLRSRIRLYTISDQDDTGAWIRARYPDLFYIVSIHGWNDYSQATWTGINLATCACVDNQTVLNPWLDANIRLGPLGSQYPQVMYGMEGDTPSFLWLVQNGLVYQDRIDWGTWGGRYNRPVAAVNQLGGLDTNQFVNTVETVIGADGGSYTDHRATIWRWRAAYQDDFAARMQWTLAADFTNASHPPVVNVNGHQGPEPLFVKIAPNQTYKFNASLTYDPDSPADNSKLSYEWTVYGEPTGWNTDYGDVQMQANGTPGVGDMVLVNDAGFTNVTVARDIQITAPQVQRNTKTGLLSDFHLLLQVTNNAGKYPIRRYLRVVLEYEQ